MDIWHEPRWRRGYVCSIKDFANDLGTGYITMHTTGSKHRRFMTAIDSINGNVQDSFSFVFAIYHVYTQSVMNKIPIVYI